MLDPLKLQSLVDGECDAATRREIIQLCDANSSQWRNVALAFIEEQAFQQELSMFNGMSLSNGGGCSVTAITPNCANQSLTELSFSKNDSSPLSESTTIVETCRSQDFKVRIADELDTNASHSKAARAEFPWKPALAASLTALAMFAAGRLTAPTFNHRISPADQIASTYESSTQSDYANNLRNSSGSNNSEATLNTNHGSLTQLAESSNGNGSLPDLDNSSVQSVVRNDSEKASNLPEITLPNAHVKFRAGNDEIPLYAAEDVHPSVILANQATELQKLQNEWTAKGISVDVEPSFIAGSLRDGRRWVIPVPQFEVTPIGQ